MPSPRMRTATCTAEAVEEFEQDLRDAPDGWTHRESARRMLGPLRR